jgi:hypothetical protein
MKVADMDVQIRSGSPFIDKSADAHGKILRWEDEVRGEGIRYV